MEALRDPDGGVPKGSGQSLGRMGDQAAVPAPTAAPDDVYERVREAAGRALERLAKQVRGRLSRQGVNNRELYDRNQRNNHRKKPQ